MPGCEASNVSSTLLRRVSSVLPAALQPPIFRSPVTPLGEPLSPGEPLAPADPEAPGEPVAAPELVAVGLVAGLPAGVLVADVVPPGLGLLPPVPQATTVSTTAVNSTVHRLVMCPPHRRMEVRGINFRQAIDRL